jgi:hypothetical protein
MLKFLQDNEATERNVLRLLRYRQEWTYKHYLPPWIMQSAFLHGDQVIVFDVIDFTESGELTGTVHLAPSHDASVPILFTALQLHRTIAFDGFCPTSRLDREACCFAKLNRATLPKSPPQCLVSSLPTVNSEAGSTPQLIAARRGTGRHPVDADGCLRASLRDHRREDSSGSGGGAYQTV